MDEQLRTEVKTEVRNHVAELFREDAAKHRDFLERMLNRVIWAIGILLIVILAVGAFFFGKSVETAADAGVKRMLDEAKLFDSFRVQVDKAVIAQRDEVERQVRDRFRAALDDQTQKSKIDKAVNERIQELKRISATELFSAAIRLPVGSIVAWHSKLPGTPPLPAEWAECNGQTISDRDSPYYKRRLPNLNGERRFLRGGTESGRKEKASRVAVTLETNENMLYFDASGRNMTGYNTEFDEVKVLGPNQRGFVRKDGSDNAPGQIYAGTIRPTNMSVIWIMRIK